jgi:hypothetical protein
MTQVIATEPSWEHSSVSTCLPTDGLNARLRTVTGPIHDTRSDVFMVPPMAPCALSIGERNIPTPTKAGAEFASQRDDLSATFYADGAEAASTPDHPRYGTVLVKFRSAQHGRAKR